MRFTNFLLALPFVASAFAAPVVQPVDIVTPSVNIVEKGIVAPQLDVLSIVAELQASVDAIVIIDKTSVEADVELCLQAVITAFDTCGDALGIDLSLGVDVEIDLEVILGLVHTDDEVKKVADILAKVVAKVELIISGIDDSLLDLPIISELLYKVNSALCAILKGVDLILAGVLDLVCDILGGLGIVLDGILGDVLGLLGL